MSCITPCGLCQHSLGRSAALLFLPIAPAIGCKKRLASHPDLHYPSHTRVMQDIPRARRWPAMVRVREFFNFRRSIHSHCHGARGEDLAGIWRPPQAAPQARRPGGVSLRIGS
jgi:hypothetical protein